MAQFAPWVGGNAQMARDIITQLGEHRSYMEPFCGGGSVFCMKRAARKEIINDAHPELINMITVMASTRWAELYKRLEQTYCSEDIRDQAIELIETTFEPPIASITNVSRSCIHNGVRLRYPAPSRSLRPWGAVERRRPARCC
jgi:site-specific DNA-adenine methylase